MDQVIDTGPWWAPKALDETVAQQTEQPLSLPLPTGGPPAAGPAPTPAQRPPQGVISTTPTAQQAEAPVDDDADLPQWESVVQGSRRRTLSHRGDFRSLEADIPRWEDFYSKDPRVANLDRAEEMMSMLAPKDQVRAANTLKQERARLQADAQRQRAQAVLAAKGAARKDIETADYGDKSPEAIERRMSGVKTADEGYDLELQKMIDSGDPQKRQQGELGKLVHARELLTPKLYNPLVSTVAARNGMDPMTAVYAVQSMVTPIYGDKGFNGLKGRAATTYQVIGSDAAGNPIVQFRDGRKAVVPDQYFSAIETARRRGYDLLKQRADEIRKERASGGGWVGRQIKGVTEWARGMN